MMASLSPADPAIGSNATAGHLADRARIIAGAGIAHGPEECANPIRLAGSRTVVDKATGVILHRLDSATLPEGTIAVSCGNRRASACPSCSALYKWDAYQLIAAGLRGGKNTPAHVTDHPRLFVTLTALSFGPVHLGPDKNDGLRPCHPRRDGASCQIWHRTGDRSIGTPIDPDTYDYAGHVLFNAHAGALWSRFTIEIRRVLAEHAGLTRSAFAKAASLAFAKVAEFQVRGVVHFHAVIRLDGPDGPADPAPGWASAAVLGEAVRAAARRATVRTPQGTDIASRVLAWGAQIDVRTIGETGEADRQMSDALVARYVAKYATRSTETAGVELRRLTCRACSGDGVTFVEAPDGDPRRLACRRCHGTGRRADPDRLGLTAHARALIAMCWRLGADEALGHLMLRRWAHMLGFRGHFATKSCAYSTTFAELRAERASFTANMHADALGIPSDDTVQVVNRWRYAGRRHAAPSRPPARRDRSGPPGQPPRGRRVPHRPAGHGPAQTVPRHGLRPHPPTRTRLGHHRPLPPHPRDGRRRLHRPLHPARTLI